MWSEERDFTQGRPLPGTDAEVELHKDRGILASPGDTVSQLLKVPSPGGGWGAVAVYRER